MTDPSYTRFGSITIREQGNVWIVYRFPGEAVSDFITRAVNFKNEGVLTANEQCITFDCNGSRVTLCLPCMVGETEEQCLARVREAVALYKDAAGC